MVRNIIQKYKQFFAIACVLISFLFLHNHVYCHPLLLTLITPAIGYFSSLSPEFYAGKIIDKVFEYSPWILGKTVESLPTITWYTGIVTLSSISGVGLLYLGEFVYNRNYIITKYLESQPILGHAIKGYKYFFVKQQNDIQYVPVVKNLVKSLGLLPKPKIEIREVEKIVTQIEERPVIQYHDRPQLRFLHNKLDQIEQSIFFINDNSNFYNLITQEMQNLQTLSYKSSLDDEIFVSNQELTLFLSNISKIEYRYADYSMPVRPTIGTIIRTIQNPNIALARVYGYQDPFESRLFAHYSEQSNIQLNVEVFKKVYPKIFLLLERKALEFRGTDPRQYVSLSLNIGYKAVGRGFLSRPKIDIDSFSLEYVKNANAVVKPVLSEIEEFFELSMRAEKETLQQLISEVRGFILSNTNSEIDEYLERRLQTDVLINKTKDLMDLELYIKAKRTRPMSYREPEPVLTQEVSNQEPLLENGSVENIEIINPIATIIQNPLMMFAAALSTFVVSDFHNLEFAANSLLGFTKIPGFNDAFMEIWRMNVEDLQTTYNFTQAGAQKAREIIDRTFDLVYPESSVSSSGTLNMNASNVQIPWGNIMYIGGAVLIGVGITWLYFKSVQNGTSTESVAPIVDNISSTAKDWHAYVLSEINKL